MSTKRTVWTGNFDRGIDTSVFVANIGDALGTDGTKVKDGLAAKCRAVAPRALFIPEQEGAVLLYDVPEPAVIHYVESLYGYSPEVLAPREIDDSESLNLVADALRCDRTMHYLRSMGERGSWILDPFIHDPLIFDLATAAGLPVLGMHEDDVRQGRVQRLNDKRVFVETCRQIGIPVPEMEIVQGWDNVIAAAIGRYEAEGRVHLRRANAAGGLGVVEITEELLEEAGLSLEAYLEDAISGNVPETWDRDYVLVAEYLDMRSSPSTLAFVDQNGGQFRASSDQVVRGGSFYGAVYPWRQPEEVAEQLTAWTMQYAAWFLLEGGRGYFNIDWGVTTDGKIVAFESNARYTGSVHPKIIARRLRADGQIGYVESNDAFKLPKNLEYGFEEAVRRLTHVAWSDDRQSGVVITIPPKTTNEVDKKTGTYFRQTVIGLVAVASSARERDELYAEARQALSN